MARVSKAIVEAVRSVVEPLEVRRLLTIVTLDGTGSGGNLDFGAYFNSTTNKIDIYQGSNPDTGAPLQSVAASQDLTVKLQDFDGNYDTFTLDAPGYSVKLDASDTDHLQIYAIRGNIAINSA